MTPLPSSPRPNTPAPPRVTDAAAVALLRRMVEIPSLSDQEADLAGFLLGWMARNRFRVEHDEVGNAIGQIGDADAEHSIVLLGHMDTVPGDVPVRAQGDLLYGRGTVDAKGPLATFLTAAANAVLPTGVRVIVIGAVEEESATSRGARAIIDRFRPSACIIGEPSAWHGVTIGYKGRLVADCTVRRAVAHSAGPHPSASDGVIGWWASVLAWVEARNAGRVPVFERVQASVRSLSSESDGIEQRARLVAGFRLPPTVEPAELDGALRELAGQSGVGATLITSGIEPAFVADRTNPVVRALGNSIRAHGHRPAIRVKTGTSDMNVVGPRWHCPIAAYGPGDSALDHTPNEHISMEEYLRANRILTEAIEHLAAELGEGPCR